MTSRRSAWLAATGIVALTLGAGAMAQGNPSTLDTAKAKNFIGEWVLTVEGRGGPQERSLSIRDVGGKVGAEFGGGRGGPVSISDISMQGTDLVLKFQQGGRQGPVDVVMTLTPKDGGLVVKQDRGGQSTSGTGKKK